MNHTFQLFTYHPHLFAYCGCGRWFTPIRRPTDQGASAHIELAALAFLDHVNNVLQLDVDFSPMATDFPT